MGTYTELVLKCDIKADIPDDVEQVLRHLFRTDDHTDVHDTPAEHALPAHRFFKLPRWDCIGRGSSFYHTPFALSQYMQPNNEQEGGDESKTYKGGYIFSRSDLKNYDDEIATFLDWLQPYIEEERGMCIGWTWHENEITPTLIFKR
jgi:hypothetical protein